MPFLLPEDWKINFIWGKIVMEFWNKRLIKSWIHLKKVRVSLLFWSTYEWTSTSWNLLFVWWRLNLLVIFFLWFWFCFLVDRTFWFGRLSNPLTCLILLFFVFHEWTFRNIIRGTDFGVVKCELILRVGRLWLLFREEFLKDLHLVKKLKI